MSGKAQLLVYVISDQFKNNNNNIGFTGSSPFLNMKSLRGLYWVCFVVVLPVGHISQIAFSFATMLMTDSSFSQ